MCGITGIVPPGDGRALSLMMAALAHRGPDGAGRHESEECALGHTRLSIIDLETGAQPIANEAGDIVLVCNGEIYNSPELRRELIGRGHEFRTRTDVEVIVHLYEELGTACVRRLRGMFAFALWDRRRGRLMLARDPMGQKPLFYHEDGGRLAFASEAKALLAAGIATPEVDLDGLWHYVSMRYLPDDRSLFSGIRKLPAGTWLCWDKGRITVERYWDIDFTRKAALGQDEWADMLADVLREAVDCHLLSDVRVGALVSGGIDSSLVAAMAASRSAGQRLPSFTIGVDHADFNELPYARMAAERCGFEAHERVVHPDLIAYLPVMVHHMDEPVDPFGFGVYMACALASEHVKVVLTGDGGDESFAGYDRYLGQRLVDYYALLPRSFRKTVMAALARRLPNNFGYKNFAQKLSWLNDLSLRPRGERYAYSLSQLRFTDEAKRQLFTPDAVSRLEEPDSMASVLRLFNAGNADDLVDRMLYTDLRTRMPDHLLTTVDRMSMAHSIEARPPLVDQHVVEFAASLPAAAKLKGSRLKHVLKQVSERYLPRELIYRPKQGFSFPIARWMRQDWQGLLRRLPDTSRFVERGIFVRAFIERIVGEHLSGRVDHNYRLWILINLEVWHRLKLEGLSVEAVGRDLMLDLAPHAPEPPRKALAPEVPA